MSIEERITSTSDVENRVLNFLIYGAAGAGKTYMARTCAEDGRTLALSCEAGMESLSDVDIDHIEINSFDGIVDAYSFLEGGDHDYAWVVLDSISEMADICLAEEKQKTAHGQQAYGNMQDRITRMLRRFRGLDLHTYFAAKQQREQIDGQMLYCPYMPGKTLTKKRPISHDFDFVFPIRVHEDEDGERHRYLQTVYDGTYEAKSRDPLHRLDTKVAPDLGRIRATLIDE